VAPALPGCSGDETTTTEATDSATDSETSSETAGPPACVGNLGAGDLVITEVMSNPSGADAGFEWFELHNPGSGPIALEGLNIVLSRSDGSSEKQHAMVTDLEIAPGGYVTAGNLADASQLVFMDYGYADVLGDMSNGAGWLRINCGDTEVDSVTWLTDREGASHTFDGYLPPDSLENDELGLWCDAQSFPDYYLTGDLGTPQLANDWCPPPAGFCYDGDDLRELDPPGAGDLVITEIMPDAEGTDEGQEWFEVYVQRDLDLNGTELARTLSDDPIVMYEEQAQCAQVSAGEYLLFGQSENPEQNGGLPPPDYVYKHSKLSLTNNDGSLTLSHGGNLVDTVSYPDSESGRALSLDPDFVDADLNDSANLETEDGAWCLALGTYGPGGQGTPRAANSDCGQCIDAMGNPRDPVLPQLGDLTITEFMANPAGADGSREWLELYVGNTSVDLMHVHVGKSTDDLKPLLPAGEAPPGACMEAPANTYLVLAKEVADNGDLPTVDFLFQGSLGNSGPGVVVYEGLGTELDDVTYTNLSVQDGASRSFMGTPDPALNDNADDDGTWCTTATDPELAYTENLEDPDQNYGTPGQANQCQ